MHRCSSYLPILYPNTCSMLDGVHRPSSTKPYRPPQPRLLAACSRSRLPVWANGLRLVDQEVAGTLLPPQKPSWFPGVREHVQGLLEGLEVVGADRDGGRSAVARDGHPFMCPLDSFDDRGHVAMGVGQHLPTRFPSSATARKLHQRTSQGRRSGAHSSLPSRATRSAELRTSFATSGTEHRFRPIG